MKKIIGIILVLPGVITLISIPIYFLSYVWAYDIRLGVALLIGISFFIGCSILEEA